MTSLSGFASPARTQRLAGSAVILAICALLVGVLLWFVGALRHSVLEVILIVLLGTVLIVLLPRAVTGTALGAERAYWASTPREEAVPPAALDYRLIRLRRDLRDAVERDDRTDEIHPLLRELTAERLRARHGIDLDDDPEQARAVLDAALWTYLTRPPSGTKKRSRSALHTAIEGIEKI